MAKTSKLQKLLTPFVALVLLLLQARQSAFHLRAMVAARKKFTANALKRRKKFTANTLKRRIRRERMLRTKTRRSARGSRLQSPRRTKTRRSARGSRLQSPKAQRLSLTVEKKTAAADRGVNRLISRNKKT